MVFMAMLIWVGVFPSTSSLTSWAQLGDDDAHHLLNVWRAHGLVLRSVGGQELFFFFAFGSCKVMFLWVWLCVVCRDYAKSCFKNEILMIKFFR